MTSKISIDNRELLQKISTGEAAAGIDFGNAIVRELAAFRLAAMDSKPVCFVSERNLANLTKHQVSVYVKAEPVMVRPVALYRHAQPTPETEREPIAWLNDAYLARGVVDGEAGSEDAGPGYIPVYREASPAPPAPVVQENSDPRDAFEAVFPMPKHAQRCGKGYACTAYSAWDAQNFIQKWEGWNACRAAMLQEPQKSAGESNNCRSSENVQVMQAGNSPVIPDDTLRMNWLVSKTVNVREPVVYGSHSLFWSQTISDDWSEVHATTLREQIDAAMLAAAPQEVKSES
ncbi:hypothetical protein [Klebsiella grimontii]|uniref:hypothetical protein n=1 Tax=Klebsiella grimontii TaxID=2058152 RepID=UPI002931EF42|nr:hypothetical protein [Klebsiella grimontii]